MRMKPALTQEDVAVMVAACHAKEKELGRTGTIAVVDFGGSLLFLTRPDTQSPNSVDVAIKKAQTAAYRERPSSNLESRVKDRPGWLMFPNGLAMSGGIPIFYKGECIGVDEFGASAPGPLLYEKYGITVDAVVAAAKKSMAA